MKKHVVNPSNEKIEPLTKVLREIAETENIQEEILNTAADFIDELEEVIEGVKNRPAGKIILNEVLIGLRK